METEKIVKGLRAATVKINATVAGYLQTGLIASGYVGYKIQ